MKIKVPFRLTYDGPFKIRVWGYGLGRLAGLLNWGYNTRGHAGRLPYTHGWAFIRNKAVIQ